MKTLAILTLATTAAIAATEIAVPVAYNRERYEETRATPPFVLATKVEKVDDTPKEPPFANMFIVGLGKSDGKDYVTISEVGKEATPIRLYGNEEQDGITVQQVIWSDDFGKSRVKIKKGSETGEIGFNQASVNSAKAGTGSPQAAPGNRPPGATGGVLPPGMNRPTNSPVNNVVPPNTGIPRPGGGPSFQPPPTFNTPRPTGSVPPGQPNNSGAPAQSRQRIRVINNK